MSIPLSQAQRLFTQTLAARFSDRRKPNAFGRSFFTEIESASKLISIQVERNNELVAVDVTRGTEGNRVNFGKSTEKIFEPPYYNQYFDVTELDGYDTLYSNQADIAELNYLNFADNVATKMDILMDQVDRAYEKQCWQVLQSGVVTLKKGINIDFKRKSQSMVDLGSGDYWDSSAVDPNTVLLQGCEFLNAVGKMVGNTVNVIMGPKVLQTFLNNVFVQNRGKVYNYNLDLIVPNQRMALGNNFHGQLSVDSYRINLWTYPENYTDDSGTQVTYLNSGEIIMVPEVPKFCLSYAAVPQLLFKTDGSNAGITPKKGKFLVYEYTDERTTTHNFGVKSAGVAIPVAVDQIFTAQVVAA